MGSQKFFFSKKWDRHPGKQWPPASGALFCQAFFSFKHSCEGTVQVHKEFWAPASKSARTCWWPDYNRWDNELRCTVRKQCLFHGRRLIHRNNTINSDPLIWGYLLHYFTVIRKCFSRIFSTMEFQRILSLNKKCFPTTSEFKSSEIKHICCKYPLKGKIFPRTSKRIFLKLVLDMAMFRKNKRLTDGHVDGCSDGNWKPRIEEVWKQLVVEVCHQ